MTAPSGGTGGGSTAGSEVLDARGVCCPMPVIMLARWAAARPAGGTVTVLWTDPAAATDIPAWARMRGHRVVPDEGGRRPAGAGHGDGAGPDDTATTGRTVVVLTPRVG